MKQTPIVSNQEFQPCQIVCLEYEHTRLYAEVIQVVTSRQMCWARPLMLAVCASDRDAIAPPELATLYDLRQDSDLLWPISLFRPAVDTEVIPLLVQLDTPETQTNQIAHQQLKSFIQQVWQANRQEF